LEAITGISSGPKTLPSCLVIAFYAKIFIPSKIILISRKKGSPIAAFLTIRRHDEPPPSEPAPPEVHLVTRYLPSTNAFPADFLSSCQLDAVRGVFKAR
jgi:hypothetical protein